MTVDRNDEAQALDPEALNWALRTGDPLFEDWDGFTAWLETEPARAGRYDAAVAALAEVQLDVAAVAEHTEVPLRFAAAPRGGWRSGRRWFGGAMAAALIGAVGLGAWTQRAQPYVVETADGNVRTLPLADGSALVLAGGTRVRLDHSDPRVATLERGEVLFRIRHNARDPFRVTVRGTELTDLGTVFDVGLREQVGRVAVAEGAVMVDPAGARVRLDPGQAARIEGDRIIRTTIDPAEVGGWREGRLAFDNVSLTEVAADLSRHMGVRVTAAAMVAERRFRGTLDLDRLRGEPALLGALLDVRVRATEEGWTLEPPR